VIAAAQQFHDSDPVASTGFRLPSLDPSSTAIISFALGFVLSKFAGLQPGYALDDYVAAQQFGTTDLWRQLIGQGRFTFALLHEIIRHSELSQPDFAVVSLFAAAVGLGGLASRFWRGTSHSTLVVASASFLLGAHPYITEYVTFRQAILPLAVMSLLAWGALLFYDRDGAGRSKRRLLLGCLLAILATGINQLAVPMMAIVALVADLRTAFHEAPGRTTLRQIALAVLRAAIATGVVVAGYAVVSHGLQVATGVGVGDSRAALLEAGHFSERLKQVGTLLHTLAIGKEALTPALAKYLWWAAWLLTCALAFKSRTRIAVALLVLVAGSILAIIPVAVGAVWWPVARTLIAVPLAGVGAFSLLDGSHVRRVQQTVALLLVMAGVLLCAESHSILRDQQRINRWDQLKAREIASRVAVLYPGVTQLALVGGGWAYPADPGMAQGDMNVSALSVPWAVDPLFDEATGNDMHVRVAPERQAVCASRPHFPDPSSIVGDAKEVVICL
jgi:hypothetical protein